MKYLKTQGIYKASNVTFNKDTLEAVSYNWWILTKVIDEKLVFNNFNYSNTTIKHQHKIRRLLQDLGIEIDIEVECPGGLQDLESGVRHHSYERDALIALTQKPRTKAEKNAERLKEAAWHQDNFVFLKTILDRETA